MNAQGSRAFLVWSGYNFRAVLAFCRALQLAGQTPAIVASGADDPVFRTREARNVVRVRSGRALELADFAQAVRAARGRTGAERCVLAPSSEFLVRWALQHRGALEQLGCDLPLPDEAVYRQVTEKAAFTAFCRGRGLPVPAEREGELALPCVAKPRCNVTPDGRSLYPWLLRTPADLARFKAGARTEEFFFQEWVEGRSFYLLFHLPHHGPATIYSQENLAQQPGGKSIVLARAATLHREAEARRWEEALRVAGFFGLAMIELRQRGPEWVLIEANPRLWGPLQLCLEGCPALLMNYIAEHSGVPVPAVSRPAAQRAPFYFWAGGLTAGDPVWHGGAPRHPRRALARRLGSEIYLRRDAWRQFVHEQRAQPRSSTAATSLAPLIGPELNPTL